MSPPLDHTGDSAHQNRSPGPVLTASREDGDRGARARAPRLPANSNRLAVDPSRSTQPPTGTVLSPVLSIMTCSPLGRRRPAPRGRPPRRRSPRRPAPARTREAPHIPSRPSQAESAAASSSSWPSRPVWMTMAYPSSTASRLSQRAPTHTSRSSRSNSSVSLSLPTGTSVTSAPAASVIHCSASDPKHSSRSGALTPASRTSTSLEPVSTSIESPSNTATTRAVSPPGAVPYPSSPGIVEPPSVEPAGVGAPPPSPASPVSSAHPASTTTPSSRQVPVASLVCTLAPYPDGAAYPPADEGGRGAGARGGGRTGPGGCARRRAAP